MYFHYGFLSFLCGVDCGYENQDRLWVEPVPWGVTLLFVAAGSSPKKQCARRAKSCRAGGVLGQYAGLEPGFQLVMDLL